MKLIVTGSRDWEKESHIWTALNIFTEFSPLVELIHGHCLTGADQIADNWAEFRNYHKYGPVFVTRYPAKWTLHGKAAGPIRNREMIRENLDADYVLAFPLGESRGTRGCMEIAEEFGLNVINLGEK